jgi:hypothetical protein
MRTRGRFLACTALGDRFVLPNLARAFYQSPGSMGALIRSVNPNLQTGQEEPCYPNQQSARLRWYHDHAHDITRLNAYAGLATTPSQDEPRP